jgi:hypothetical protein
VSTRAQRKRWAVIAIMSFVLISNTFLLIPSGILLSGPVAWAIGRFATSTSSWPDGYLLLLLLFQHGGLVLAAIIGSTLTWRDGLPWRGAILWSVLSLALALVATNPQPVDLVTSIVPLGILAGRAVQWACEILDPPDVTWHGVVLVAMLSAMSFCWSIFSTSPGVKLRDVAVSGVFTAGADILVTIALLSIVGVVVVGMKRLGRRQGGRLAIGLCALLVLGSGVRSIESLTLASQYQSVLPRPELFELMDGVRLSVKHPAMGNAPRMSVGRNLDWVANWYLRGYRQGNNPEIALRSSTEQPPSGMTPLRRYLILDDRRSTLFGQQHGLGWVRGVWGWFIRGTTSEKPKTEEMVIYVKG